MLQLTQNFGVVQDRIPGSNYLDLKAACLNFLDYLNQFEVIRRVLGLLQHGQLMILSSRLNEQIEMCLKLFYLYLVFKLKFDFYNQFDFSLNNPKVAESLFKY